LKPNFEFGEMLTNCIKQKRDGDLREMKDAIFKYSDYASWLAEEMDQLEYEYIRIGTERDGYEYANRGDREFGKFLQNFHSYSIYIIIGVIYKKKERKNTEFVQNLSCQKILYFKAI
jgi:hypothetical protein